MTFTLGLLFAIPLAIVANLLTPRFQRRLDARSQTRTDERVRQQKVFRDEVESYRQNPERLSATMVVYLIRIAYFGAIFGLAAGLVIAAAQAIRPISDVINGDTVDVNTDVIEGLYIASQVIGLVGTLIVLNLARSARRLYTAVKGDSSVRVAPKG